MDFSNIFIFISLATLILAILAGTYTIIISLFRNSSFSFLILSFVIASISLANIFLLKTFENNMTAIWGYIFISGIFLVPPSMFHFITNITDNRFSRIDKKFKPFFYLPGSVFIIIIIIDRGIFFIDTPYGHTIGIASHILLYSMIYLGAFWIIILTALIYELRRNYILKRPNSTVVLLSIGSLIYLAGNTICHILINREVLGRIPANALFLTILYISCILGIINKIINSENIVYRNIFEYVKDSIILTDNNGKFRDINKAAYELLFTEGNSNPGSINTRKVKKALFLNICNKNDRKKLIRNLRDRTFPEIDFDTCIDTGNGKRYFNISLSPISGRRRRVYGKLIIMKDITEYKILHNNLQKQLEKDFLTGVYNKMFFNKRLDQEMERAKRYDEALSLIMIDIDKFKDYNDFYGHLEGDRILKKTADILQDNIRNDIDIVARFGGDEFSVILVNTDIDKAKKIGERILACYNNIKFNQGSTSLSIGVCQYSPDIERASFIRRTDKTMYMAKRTGGNNINICS